jgi:hypothetical protein
VQVSGTVSIDLPITTFGTTIEADSKDMDLMNKYLAAMDSWTTTIKETINKELQRKRITPTALA